jgi:hypothetical protein
MADRYWVGNGGDWSDTAHWSTSSGGAPGASVPTSSDDVYFDANSINIGAQTIDALSAPDILGRNLSIHPSNNPAMFWRSHNEVYGNISFSGFTLTSLTFLNLKGSGSFTVNTGGVTLHSLGLGAFSGAVTSTITLLSDLSLVETLLIYNNVTLNGNGFNVTVEHTNPAFASKIIGNSSSLINLGSGTWKIISSQAEFSVKGETINPGTSLIWLVVTGGGFGILITSSNGGTNTFYDFKIDGILEMYGSNTFRNFEITPGSTVKFPLVVDYDVTTVDSLIANGAVGNNCFLRGNAFFDDEKWSIISSNTILVNFCNIKDSDAVGTFYACNSTDGGNNTGWLFECPPASAFPQQIDASLLPEIDSIT